MVLRVAHFPLIFGSQFSHPFVHQGDLLYFIHIIKCIIYNCLEFKLSLSLNVYSYL